LWYKVDSVHYAPVDGVHTHKEELSVTPVDTFIDRNRRFAVSGIHAGLPTLPKLQTIIIGCVDPRVDPAAILGLELGDAVIIRNLGGRVTPNTFQTITALGMIAQSEGATPGFPGLNLIVLHHTDCGITHLGEHTDLLAKVFGVDPGDVGAKAVSDPKAAVAVDVAAIKANPFLPAGFLVAGLVYDVATGLVDVVVSPAPLRSAVTAA
jgi:carbonic anhydrase